MTNEEMQSAMQFILEQQAHFAANIQKLQEEHLRADERFARLEDSIERTVNLVTAIAHAQAQTEVNLARTDERLNNLVSTQAQTEVNLTRTDERLNNLISVFERYLQENRNGTS
jgi:polyribonucleotide nucleotidyltransferase